MPKKKIVCFVTGSIAAYKAVEIVRELTKKEYDVYVVMSESAQKFITPLTFQALTMNRVFIDLFDERIPSEIEHITLVRDADLCVVVPATANTINKLASGIADSIVSTTLLAKPKHVPLLVAPAMNTNMYVNEATEMNMQALKKRGAIFIDPDNGLLACGDVGKGALAKVEVIIQSIEQAIKGDVK